MFFISMRAYKCTVHECMYVLCTRFHFRNNVVFRFGPNRCHRDLGPPEFSVRRTHFPRELGPPPGPKSLDAQNQLNRTHFPRELSPPRTEISVRIYYTLVHVHQKLARFDSRVKWRVVGKVFVMKPCRRSKSTLQKAATPWGYYSEAF